MNPTTPTMTAPFEESAAPDIVQLEAVTKRFRVRKDNSLKDRIVHLGKLGKAHRQDFYAVDSISFSIEAGTTVGLMGANGSGKSTLLKLIGGRPYICLSTYHPSCPTGHILHAPE